MTDDDVCGTYSNYIQPIVEHFSGEYDDDQLRTGDGRQTWDGRRHQNYTGTFLCNNLHGDGRYVDVNGSKSYMYEGTFYANDYEGYSNVTYLNGDYFEGLFKQNRRFGPGVYTYVDGTQNVGLWYGTQLVRLSCVVLGEWVPKLARSPSAKTKLLKYRKLVPIRQEYEDIAKDILVKLNAAPEVIASSDKLYNPSISNLNSLFFNRKAYDMEFFGEIDCTIDVAIDNNDKSSDILSKISSCNASTSSMDIVQGVLDYLLENVDIFENFPEQERRVLVYETITAARKQFQMERDTVDIRAILDQFMVELEDILSKGTEEKTLIVNKKNIRKKLPRCDKAKTEYTVKKVAVTDLLAWNNDEISIEMMLHVFAHRNKEDSISFSIARLLTGDRACFNDAGEIEVNCVVFLNSCSIGNGNAFIKIFQENGLNPDLCDARGNTGVIFAAARDKWNIIKLLCDVGANLDAVNDEGLTALGICVLRYIALRNDIRDWERAFLPDALVTLEEEMQVKQWHPHVSLVSLNALNAAWAREPAEVVETDSDMEFLGGYNKIERILKAIGAEENESPTDYQMYEELKHLEIDRMFKTFQEPYEDSIDLKQKYIFNVGCVQLAPYKKFRQNKPRETDSETRRSRSFFSKQQQQFAKSQANANFVKENKLKIVLTTIKVLLGCGADPNLSRVPLPILLLAVFGKDLDLLSLILSSNADPDITSEDEGVTALHTLAALPFTVNNLNMFKLLLKMGADPNIRTTTYHWAEEKEKLLGQREPISEDLGKTAMHILSMRYDFQDGEEIQQLMIEYLIKHGGRLDDSYLGHEPFTLAILRGNLDLIRFYLSSGEVDPYKVLGEGMGVATTILILRRYAKALPLEICMEVYDLFVEMNVNPLVEFEGYDNAIEFMASEYSETGDATEKSNKKSEERKRSTKFKLASSASSRNRKTASNEDVRNYLLECTRIMLQKHIQYKAYKYLKRFIIQNVDLDDEVLVTMVTFLPMKDLVPLLQLLIHREIIKPKPTNFYILLTMLQLSKKHNKSNAKRPKVADISALAPALIVRVLDWINVEENPTIYFNMIEPALDTLTDKYKVCFYCCRRTGKDLIVCPNCGLVYFCSERCNKLSNRQSTIHKCNILFYDSEKAARDAALASGEEYNNKSKLDRMLDYLDEQLAKQFGLNLSLLGISGDDFDFDKLASLIFDKLLQNDPKFLEKMQKSLEDADLTDLAKHIQSAKDLKAKHKEFGSDYILGDDLFLQITGQKPKLKHSRDGSAKKKKSEKDDVTKGSKKSKGIGSRKHSKSKSKSKSKSRDRGGKKKSSRSSGKASKSSKDKKSKESTRSKNKTLETIFRRDRSKGRQSKGDKSSKNAVYKHKLDKSDYTRSRKDKYEQVQARLRDKYKKEQHGAFGGLLGDMSKFGQSTIFDELGRICRRLPNKCQFFLEKLSELFPDIDFSLLFWPYVCYVDGQLYYRFLEERPLFLETYSNV